MEKIIHKKHQLPFWLLLVLGRFLPRCGLSRPGLLKGSRFGERKIW
jgi:hypothetical protein